MIKIQSIIASVRSKLGDTDHTNYRYTTEEILNALNMGLTDISQNTLAFYKSWQIQTKEGIRRYKLPNDFIMLADKKEVCHDNKLISYMDSQTLYLNFEPKEDANKKLPRIAIYYNYTEYIYDEHIDLYILNGFASPLIHFALAELFMSPNRENGLNFSEFHRQKYRESLELPLHHVRKATNKRQPRAKHRSY